MARCRRLLRRAQPLAVVGSAKLILGLASYALTRGVQRWADDPQMVDSSARASAVAAGVSAAVVTVIALGVLISTAG